MCSQSDYRHFLLHLLSQKKNLKFPAGQESSLKSALRLSVLFNISHAINICAYIFAFIDGEVLGL